MIEKHKRHVSRRDFIKQSSAGILGIGASASLARAAFGSIQAPTLLAPAMRELGKTGLKVTPVGLGATRTMDPAIVHGAIDAGIHFLDTGRGYSNGQNEVMIGKAIQGIRKNLVIQSKIDLRLRDQEQDLQSVQAVQRLVSQMNRSLEDSLKALQTECIDVMLLRGVDKPAVLRHESILAFFRKAKENGQIRACGFSAHQNQLELVKTAVDGRFWDVAMVAYNHKGAYTHSRAGGSSGSWDQPALEKELARAHENGFGIVAMKTCSGGLYAPDPDARPSYAAGLKWILQHRFVHTMAVAMSNPDQIREDVQAML